MRGPKPGAENCLFLAMLITAGLIVVLAFGVAFGNDLPIQPPVFGPKALDPPPPANAGPGLEEQDQEDPRDVPAPVFFGEEITDARATIVYVLDKSGSMQAGTMGLAVRRVQEPSGRTRMVDWALPGEPRTGSGWTGASRWERAAVETIRSVDALASNLRFDVIVYDCNTLALWTQARDASAGNKAAARAWILRWSPGGGTATGPATALGLVVPEVDAVVLLTDGQPECGDTSNAAAAVRHRAIIVRANPGVPVHVFGIGISNDLLRAFCTAIANENQGTYTEVK